MEKFIVTLPLNIARCFKGRMILWHALAIILTVILVSSGFDWRYFECTRSPELRNGMFFAVIIGQCVPMILPLSLVLAGGIFQDAATSRVGWALGQAALIGWFIASAYKSVTGRVHPPRGVAMDTSRVFHFGFMRGGIFWGWPSSHTATAFAMALALFTLFPKQKWLRIAALAYALYIGLGVSITIHWFSDFVAGAIIGTVIGVTVGKNFGKEMIRS